MVKVRRVRFRDWGKETDGVAPSRWNAVTGTWTMASNYINIANGAGPHTLVAPAEQTTVTGTIVQDDEMYFDVTMRFTAMGEGSIMYFILFASASSGTYLGNSYVVAIDADKTYLYRSDANVITEMVSASVAHVVDTDYVFAIHYNPNTGAWSIIEDGEEVLTDTESDYTGGAYIGLGKQACGGRWKLIRVRYPNVASASRITNSNSLTKEIGEAHVYYASDNTAATAFAVGDGIEIVFGSGTEYVDFWGKVEKVRHNLEDPDELVAYDWRVELLKAEFLYSGNAVISTMLATTIGNKCRVLTTGGIKTSAEPTDVRVLAGERMMPGFKRLCEEANYYIRYDGTNELVISDTFSPSGSTFTAADVMKAVRVHDLVDEVNTTNVYYSGGSSAGGGSGTDYNTYGRSEKILIDTNIPNATAAGTRASYYTNRYSGAVPVYDIWMVNASLHPGDTGTITLPYFGLTAQTFLVLEKSYDIPDSPCVRYRINITTTGVLERHGRDQGDRLGLIGENAQLGLGLQI